MKNILKKSPLLVLILAAVLLFSSVAQADTIDVTDFIIQDSDSTKTVVIWADSADAVLRAEAASEAGAATMTIGCKFDKAYALYVTENRLVSSSVSQGKITFQIPGAGVYHILEGEAPAAYTVTYHDAAQNQAPAPLTGVLSGTRLTAPVVTEVEGYLFDGWYTSAEYKATEKWNFATQTVTKNLDLYARWLPVYTVTYHANGHGTVPGTLNKVPHGTILTEPEAPEAEGYTFGGWYKTAACADADKWNFETDTVTGPVNLYAKWLQGFTVTYYANGHGTAPEPLTNVPAGSKLTEPKAPTEKGFVFQGWYRTVDCAESGKWNFATDTVTASTNLFAKWVPAYKVIYHNNGHGTAPMSLNNVPEGSKLTEPTAPTAAGYTFAGWYKSQKCADADKWNFETDTLSPALNLTNHNLHLYAKWTVKVTYDVNGHGTAPETVTGLTIGSKVTEPTAPTAEGYTFAGWYTTKEFNENDKWDFNSRTVTVDTVLYAKWLKNPATGETGEKTWAVDDDQAGTLNPTVKGLSGVVNTVDPAHDAHAVLTIVQKDPTSDVKNKIDAKANGRKLSYMDLSLELEVEGNLVENIGDTNTALLQIDLAFETAGKSYFRVYRYHGNAVQTLTESANAQGERIVVGQNKITIYAMKFSPYAIGYTEGTNKPVSSITSVTVSPKTANVSKGGTRTFEAMVIGVEDFDDEVTWSVSGNKRANTKISEDGKLTIASGEPATKLTVKATSKQDPNKYGTAEVTVTTTTSSANTGDQFRMGLWITLMALCAGGIAVLIILKKKRK